VKPGPRGEHVQVTDLAPTLAKVLRIPPPAASEGRPLGLAP
jgi:arylsulfatase A-like enzyme